MRLCYLFAIPSGQDVGTVFSALAVSARTHVKAGDTQRLTVGGVQFITRKIAAGVTPGEAPSSSGAGTWDVYGCIPLVDNEIAAKTFFNALTAAYKSNANKEGTKRHMLGPWTAKQFDKVGWCGDALLYEQEPDSISAEGVPSATTHKKPGAAIRFPWVIAGDNPEQLAAVEVS